MARVDRAERVIQASPDHVFAALVEPQALEAWLPPNGMSGRFEHFDARPGGGYRMVLSYDIPGHGKTTADSDVVAVRFAQIEPGVRIVQEVDFVSDDPRFSGTMTMTWEVTAVEDGSRVEIRAENVPVGVDADDHATGLASSLCNLAEYLAQPHH